MVKMAEQEQVAPIYVHAFFDGRDTPPRSAKSSLQALESYIATIVGKF